MNKQNPVNRLLRRNVSVGQLVGYALANFVGLAIVLTALQFYLDIRSAASGEDSFISRDYLIISKRVDGLGTLATGSKINFSKNDIDEIAVKPWVRRTGAFTAADFNVWASLDFGGRRMSTSLFLESIPSSFFDVTPPGWGYEPGSGEPLPVVISKDYLTLYNFGYAATHGMPQISEEMVSLVPLRLSLSGNGRQDWIDARIVGFSSRLNTIAVPEEFMAWANSIYSENDSVTDPSRLIVELRRAGDPDATKFFESKGYEVAGDKVNSGRAAFFLNITTTVVIAVGLTISLLAFFILLLSIYLLLQKNRGKIHRLMELGYTPAEVSRRYIIMVIWVNGAVLIASLAVMITAHLLWSGALASLGAEVSGAWTSVIAGVVVMALITLLNIVAIRRRVASSFRL